LASLYMATPDFTAPIAIIARVKGSILIQWWYVRRAWRCYRS
jgi:hypothetical protein